MINSVNEIAWEWIEDHAQYAEMEVKEFCIDFSQFLDNNWNHKSDCFNDTSYWAKDAGISADELEKEIERLCEGIAE